MTAAGSVHLERRGGVAWVNLSNPGRRNALTVAMTHELSLACDEVDADPTVGAVVVRGADGYFCSGADREELSLIIDAPLSEAATSAASALYDVVARFAALTVPTVAVVDGGAVGAGLNLALAADVLLLADDAVLDSGFVARGIHPGGGHLALLARAASRQVVLAMAVLGHRISAEEAVARGLAHGAYRSDQLEAAANALVEHAPRDPELTRRVKRTAALVVDGEGLDVRVGAEMERGAQLWSMERRRRGR